MRQRNFPSFLEVFINLKYVAQTATCYLLTAVPFAGLRIGRAVIAPLESRLSNVPTPGPHHT